MTYNGTRHWHVYYRPFGGGWQMHSRHKTLEDAQAAIDNNTPFMNGVLRLEYWDGSEDALNEDERRAKEWRRQASDERPPL